MSKFSDTIQAAARFREAMLPKQDVAVFTLEDSQNLVAVGKHDVEAIMSRMPVDMPRGIISGVAFIMLYRPQIARLTGDLNGDGYVVHHVKYEMIRR